MAAAGRWRRARAGASAGPCVYLARRVSLVRAASEIYKIGSSGNVARRLRELGDVFSLLSFRPCSSIEEARQVERETHARVRWPRAGASLDFYRGPAR